MARMNKRMFVLLAVAGLAALILAGCGGPKTAEITVDLEEFAFTPSTWTVPAGAQVTITMNNHGALEHEWVIMEKGYTVEAPFEDADEEYVYWEAEVEAGETGTFTFTAPSEPGDYQILCALEGHLDAGMEGTLTVE